MKSWDYIPDQAIEVHQEGALKLICADLQSHEDGIPEWVKNSADEYTRQNAPNEDRVIVILMRDKTQNYASSISCLDFSGMSPDTIEKNFRQWADPDASHRGQKVSGIQGGHGNGGKAYMVQMFSDYSLLHTVKNNTGSRYGVKAGLFVMGYEQDGRGFDVPDLMKELDKALEHTGIAHNRLPREANRILQRVSGFTLLSGFNPKSYPNKINADHLIQALCGHPQMSQTIQTCQVYVVVNGKGENNGQPLSLPKIEPRPGAEAAREIPIPKKVKNPKSNERISTTEDGKFPDGKLVLETSNVNMQRSKNLRHLHTVKFMAQGSFIGYVPVSELGVDSSYRDRIYGTCHLDSLERYKRNNRGRLASSPLVEAIEHYIASRIQVYAKEFEKQDELVHSQKDKKEVSKMNEALNKWKNRFLDTMVTGNWGGDNGEIVRPRSEPLPSGTPARIDISLEHSRIGMGVQMKPRVHFFDADGRKIRYDSFTWVSDDTNVAMVDESLGVVIRSFSYGKTGIYAEISELNLQSRKVTLEVVRITDIEILPPELEVPVGGRQGLRAVCTLSTGEKVDDVLLIWDEDDNNIARVSPTGTVFAFSPGETNVTAADDNVSAAKRALVRVVPAKHTGDGKSKGDRYPRILVSGYDQDPDTGEQRNFGPDDPPVCQDARDVDRRIWWINSLAPLAKLYLDRDEGYGYNSREWRMYHIERYIDIIIQISLSYRRDEATSFALDEWIVQRGTQEAEIQAGIVDDLAGFIDDGELPEE